MVNKAVFSVEQIRSLFPILQPSESQQPELVYLDNAATTQKPQVVIDALTDYYTGYNSNVHRGAHRLADQATNAFESARSTMATFINAPQREEVIWTRGTTESINIVANGIVKWLKPGDEIVVSELEHHANLIPWQQACQKSGATLKIAPINEFGEIDIDKYHDLLGPQTVMVAFSHVSNALGTVNPIKKLTSMAKSVGAWVLVDGAQGIAHQPVDVQDIGCDFYAFSGHKMFGPTGIGVLWGKASLLLDWPVWQTGGEMISHVTYQTAEWNTLPYKFEAGTPNIAGAIGVAAAAKWLMNIDYETRHQYEAELLEYATIQILTIPGVNIIGQAKQKAGVLSFTIDQVHSSDIGFMLDQQGVAIRSGHHCAEPLMERLGISGTARASFSLYNTREDVDRFIDALSKAKEMLC
jgi:cysteine desulfurase/selenocysteine lyase